MYLTSELGLGAYSLVNLQVMEGPSDQNGKEKPKKIGNLFLFYKRKDDAVYYSKEFIERFNNKEDC